MTPDTELTLDQVIEQMAARRLDVLATLEVLEGYAAEVETHTAELENPSAVREYLDFFRILFTRFAAQLERVAAELTTEGVKRDHIITIKVMAGTGTNEQRRCLQFRDKWINKPLPHESMRPLLNDISVTTRDQLTALSNIFPLVARLGTFYAPPPPPPPKERSFGRRDLFTRFIKR